jgi:PIN domain nuclease of toxin-antitoxin system
MNLLLDTHVFLSVIDNRFPPTPDEIAAIVFDRGNEICVSVASIWEIAIKHRLGKLAIGFSLDDSGELLAQAGFALLDIRLAHAIRRLEPLPATRDPFDRLLLAQCAVEGMKLVTLDRNLAGHPLSATG